MLDEILGQHVKDRPNIVSRVFKFKLEQIMDVLLKGQHFGRVIAAIYAIEFHKRRYPHANILRWLENKFVKSSTQHIDHIISVEIPSKESNSCHKIVSQFMVHGPCSFANKDSPCMVDEKYTKRYPKNFYYETNIDDDGYLVYKRRNNRRVIKKGDVNMDNKFIMPYNRELLLKFHAHINVEWCNQSRVIKYLFKYLTKRPDQGKSVIFENAIVDKTIKKEKNCGSG
ncbi:hypothetical protein REPUB_Repub02eG0201800 [Reevesia pubescens]